MDNMNYDILHEIMRKLNVHDIISAMSVCKIFYNVCLSQTLWMALVKVDYTDFRLFDGNCYVAYKICYALNKIKNGLNILCTFKQFCEMEEIYLGYGKIAPIRPEICHLINLRKLN